MPESEGPILGIRASGRLTLDDGDRVPAPRLEALARRFGSLRALFYLDGGFEGWDASPAC
ncbi:hypothetical protein SAMN06265365_11811 [Tistlia consotensis]|uniref:Uncharacterized protein n=1 Tax=Tistlia consotensis USBA 355 TaxID=560819 RepID=A0A1Y6CHA8_9PROT|nr:STAS/SEC14 domain-containing protein [Tistlia consotensis]SMF53254.1 hypothetical protein SAMN05428998_11912 [Tistlia consotensis USBA 355]SNR85298.1 hypothetical protein SAMN06265365_11811 [Tistlia consotensis]